MIEAEADIELGEGFKPAAEAHRKLIAGSRGLVLIPALLFAGTMIIAWQISVLLALNFPRWRMWTDLINLVGLVAGLTLALRSVARRQTRTFLAALRAIGSPASVLTRYRFDEQGIDTSSDRVSHSIPWSAVMFVMPTADHWLVQADTLTVIVPRRAFAGEAEEQAFVDFARDHLSDAARERSILPRQ